MINSFVLSVNENAKKELIGGKAFNLHKISSFKNFEVPSCVFLTTLAYDDHILTNKIENEIKKVIDEKDIEKLLEQIRKSIESAPLNKKVTIEISNFLENLPKDCTLAVRSSGTMEDEVGTSWAGQYDTILNVPNSLDEIENSVKQCWASMWKKHIISYRNKLGIEKKIPSMGVVIQKMLNPYSAGVLFTMNPINGNAEEMRIESCYGLGEGVVGGQYCTHSYALNWRNETIVQENVKSQTKKYINKHSKKDFIQLVDTTQEEKEKSSISKEEMIELMKIGKFISKEYQIPLDIEWAIENGKIFILQARPITAYTLNIEGKWSDQMFLDHCAINESLHCRSYAEICKKYSECEETVLMKSIFGKPYINNTLYNEGKYEITGFFKNLENLKSFKNEYSEFYKENYEKFKIIHEFSCYSNQELVNLYSKISDLFNNIIRFSYTVGNITRILKSQAETFLKHSNGIKLENLLVGLERENLGKESYLEIEKLAKIIKKDVESSSIFEKFFKKEFKCKDVIDKLKNNSEIHKLTLEFINRFYFLSSQDEDLSVPRYKEDQSIPFTIISNIVLNDTREVKMVDTKSLFQQEYDKLLLTNPSEKVTNHIKLLREFTHIKEEIHEMYTKISYMFRNILLEKVSRLAKEYPKLIDFIWKVQISSIDEFMKNEAPNMDLIQRMIEEAEIRLMFLQFQKPLKIVGSKKISVEIEKSKDFDTQFEMTGIGCSNGEVIGTVRVITDLSQVSEIQKDDILITSYTDPSWTIVFTLISGLICEYGNVLSHGAVVARECGIPCVVSCPDVMKIFKSGDLILLNGTKGVIQKLK